MSALPNDSIRGVLTRAALAAAIALALGCASSPEQTASEQAPADEIGLASGEGETSEAQDPWAQSASAESAAGAETSAAEAAASAAPATKLTGVSAREADGSVLVELAADGRIDGAEVFTVADPLRLVIDLPGMKSEGVAAKTEVGGALISRIRVAAHDAKVRVVVDAAPGVSEFPAQTSQALAGGMRIALGGAQSFEALAQESEAPAAETAEEPTLQVAEESAPAEPAPASLPEEEAVASTPATYTVLGVQFDAAAERDRVVIVSDGAASYSTWEPDAETFVVRIGNATIDEEAQVRISPENPGSVSLVTAFAQPELSKPEVRVVITRAAGVKPSVSQDGSMIVMDFANTAKAAAVPVMKAPPQQQLTTAGARDAAAAPVSSMVEEQVLTRSAAAPASIETNGGVDALEEGGLLTGKVYSGRRISLDFKDVEIDDVLRLIAEVSELNVIAGDEVSGQVTIRLVDVPWDQALDVILLTKGLGFVRVANVLRIAPSDVLKAEEEARLQERRAKEKLEDLVVKLQPVNYADVEDVAKLVKKLLSARGTVDVDERTNTVILKDIASVIDEATALIKAIDTQTPQVLVEAKIVEANLDFLREVGASWGAGLVHGVDPWDPDSDPNRSLGSNGFRPHNIPGVGGPGAGGSAGSTANSIAVANPITQLATGAINLGAFILDERFDVDLQLEAAESHGEGKVISSPRIVTLDNRKARIEQGVSIPFQTFEDGDAKLEFIDAVLSLDVTPHITADRSIIMKIEVERNAPDDSVPTPTGSPAIAKNEASTETLVKDGQTLVIGGIYVVRTADRESRVPYFHRLPVIGNAFKNKEVRDIRQELLVFVTPRIVVNPELGS